MTEELVTREQYFRIAVFAFPEYEKEMLQEFFDYWSEPTKNGKKMRFELEKTWDFKRRLKRWFDNSNKWNNAKQNTNIRSDVQAEFARRFA